jgi:hypothetical protein
MTSPSNREPLPPGGAPASPASVDPSSLGSAELQAGQASASGLERRPEVAYPLGIILNTLRWHLEQAWLRGTDDQVEAARREFDNLALGVRGLTSRTPPLSLQAIVLSRRDEFERALQSFERHRELESHIDRQREALGAIEDLEDLRQEACKVFLACPRALIRQLRARVVAELDESAARALELGEWVDRGVRPENVHRFMRFRPRLYQIPHVEDPWLDSGTTPHADDYNYLADHSVEPGELPPDSIWSRQVLQLCSELKLAQKHMDEVSGLLEQKPPEDLVSTVNAFDEVIRRALARPVILPDWLRIDLDHSVIYVDDVPHTVDLEVALFVQHVAAAGEKLVSFPTLKAKDTRLELLPRPDKTLNKKSNRFIKQFIEGQGGEGYRLRRR